MPATIYDIAKACNCSTTTVSKVFNNSGKISKQKRNEILKVSAKLGYFPSQSARSLASTSKSSHLIGVVLHTSEDRSITHEFFSNLLNSFRIEMENNDYDICFLRNLDHMKTKYTYEGLVRSRGIDGVLILSTFFDKPKIQQLFKSNIPMVGFDSGFLKYTMSSDNKEAVSRMVDYLVSKGHTRIAYVVPNHRGVSEERYQGFLEGLERNNIPFDARMEVQGMYYCEDAAKVATDNALKSGFNPTVIMYPDDYTAIKAIPYLRSLGYKVPKDISIVGFDGIVIATMMRPKITTIIQDSDGLGKAAAKLLLQQINHQRISNPHMVVDASIFEGETVLNMKEDH